MTARVVLRGERRRAEPAAHLRIPRWLAGLICAGFILVTLALQTAHFSSRSNYRDDEIRTVHAGMTMSPVEVMRWMSVDIHPPLWRVSATTWVSLFGPDESITRFLSALYAAAALAFMYRLAADLFGRTAALLAVFLLGTHSLFQFYAHEFRPYAALMLWVIASGWALLRWVGAPKLGYALMYVAFSAAALYTHFFALYAIAAQVIAFVLLVRWNPTLYARAFGLFALVGLSFFGWLPSFLHSILVAQPGGIRYGLPLDDPGTPGVLYESLQLRPVPLGTLLVGLGVLLPFAIRLNPLDRVRFRTAAWRKWVFVVTAAFVVIAAVGTSRFVDVLTQRNLIIILPSVAILGALALRALPLPARVIALVLILNPAVRDFESYQSNQPYQEVLAFIEPSYEAGSPIIISVDQGTGAYFTYAYYLMDRLPGQVTQADMFYLTMGQPDINLPEAPLNHTVDASPDALARFRDLIAGQERVWWITSPVAPSYIGAYEQVIAEDYTLARRETFSDRSYNYDVTVLEYRRDTPEQNGADEDSGDD